MIMTTSVGLNTLRQPLTKDDEKAHFEREIRAWYPIEFLSRVDEVVVFVSFDEGSAVTAKLITSLTESN